MKVRGSLIGGAALAAAAAAAAAAASRGRDDIGGEVAIVTGASRGLGLLLARELARHGCPLIICARDAAGLERAAAGLRATGAEVTAVTCDMTGPAVPQRLIGTAIERYGRLDIIISNAGIIQVGPSRTRRSVTTRPPWTPWRSPPSASPWRRCRSCAARTTAGSSPSPPSAAR